MNTVNNQRNLPLSTGKSTPDEYPEESNPHDGTNGTGGTNGTTQIPIEEYLDRITGADVTKPCYACGKKNWISYPDSDGFFCGTCHP